MTNEQVRIIRSAYRLLSEMQDAFDKATVAPFRYALDDLLLDLAGDDHDCHADVGDGCDNPVHDF